MNVEIINVGTELLLGEIVNTNAAALEKMCKNLGFNVYYQCVVGDNPDRLRAMLKVAFERGADCVMTTGGLGPTQDDLTKEISAEYLGLPLVYNEAEAQKVYDKCSFLIGDGLITENNFKQAYYPADAYILENPSGTANGCVMRKGKQMIINLPGPPKELNCVIERSLIPYLEQFREEQLFTCDIITMGLGESKVDTLLRDLEENQSDVTLAMYAGEGRVRIRLGCHALSQDEADEKMAPLKAIVEERLKEYIIKEGHISDALANIMVPVRFTGDLEVPEWFIPYLDDEAKLIIATKVTHKELGDVIEVSYGEREPIKIMTLMDYHQSWNWLCARIMLNLYLYLQGRESHVL
ncbi:MAG: damage-inducible protein CinA [Erysipelotrichaceae bacterium]|nr:damage-inducible protein CinA [Erysipelotrichaceae bacterium]